MTEKRNPYQPPLADMKPEQGDGAAPLTSLDASIGAIMSRAFDSAFASPGAISGYFAIFTLLMVTDAVKPPGAPFYIVLIAALLFFATPWLNAGTVGTSADRMLNRKRAMFVDYANEWYGNLFLILLVLIFLPFLLSVLIMSLSLGVAFTTQISQSGVGLAVFIVIFPIVFFFVALIVPTAIFMYHLAEAASVEESCDTFTCWSVAFSLVMANWGATFVMLLVAGAVNVLPIAASNMLVETLSRNDFNGLPARVAIAVLQALAIAFSTVFSVCLANSFYLSRSTKAER